MFMAPGVDGQLPSNSLSVQDHTGRWCSICSTWSNSRGLLSDPTHFDYAFRLQLCFGNFSSHFWPWNCEILALILHLGNLWNLLLLPLLVAYLGLLFNSKIGLFSALTTWMGTSVQVFSFVGSTGGVLVIFIIPGFILLRNKLGQVGALNHADTEALQPQEEARYGKRLTSCWRLGCGILLLCFGCLIFFVTAYVNIFGKGELETSPYLKQLHLSM